ncbi:MULTISPECIES: VanZ family protein [Bacillus]|uniref:VanZ family protein n=2 Tax=Bacillus cereus group TaxID=86661 RepID=A0AAU8EWV4_9BACI|nr:MULTISPECIES: VanZ family protein [Bacillus]MBZ4222256.1 VanZ family protein [Bacillus wiedmannii]MED2840112.1 VanZ family protein [Bacillus wiedmannii]HDR3493325.1 VanZ family protein [Bacillus wiedmannii]HDR7664670.1 VanZ family protein [Bacillus wiedmannii]
MIGCVNSLYMINGSVFIIVGVICYLIVRSIFIGMKSKKGVNWWKELISFLFVIYIGMVVAITLFPIPIGFPTSFGHIRLSINSIPFASIIKDIDKIGIAYDGDVLFMIGLIVRNVGGNILLLMPLGFLAPIIWDKFKKIKNTILLGLAISISIELLQLTESLFSGWGRITDIDDVIFNVIGSIVGYFIYKITLMLASKFNIQVLNKTNSKGVESIDN